MAATTESPFRFSGLPFVEHTLIKFVIHLVDVLHLVCEGKHEEAGQSKTFLLHQQMLKLQVVKEAFGLRSVELNIGKWIVQIWYLPWNACGKSKEYPLRPQTIYRGETSCKTVGLDFSELKPKAWFPQRALWCLLESVEPLKGSKDISTVIK